MQIECIWVISSFAFFYQKTFKRKTHLSKNRLTKRKPTHKQKLTHKQKPTHKQKKLTKRKQANKTPKAAFFFVRTKTFDGIKSRLFASCAFLVRVKVRFMLFLCV